ncbi:RING-H2 finger protein ATL79-like [Tasmannia lanceolata]|uniref:RING-H2 finger protein ATL79-like n=1 Tax=Tasmannia lanceolata TaxID=3420 RepID=UPI004064390F
MPSPTLTPFHSPIPFSRDSNSSGTWFPYRNSGNFDVNLAMILIILVCALICALALNATIRCFLRYSRSSVSNRRQDSDAVKMTTQQPPALVFTAEMKLAGESECAICITEFVNGERVRVLPRCKHGFHVKCIEEWLSSRSSCPTCRSSSSPVKKPGNDVEVPQETVPEP